MDEDNAFWDDGEWVTWTEINSHLWHLEMRERYPNADLELVPIFKDLLAIAEHYHCTTDRHLQVYGDLGELFGAIAYGIKLTKNYAQGHDGRLGKELVEVKTITPFKKNDWVEVKASGNFSKLLVVKITEEFEVSGRLVDRRQLPKAKGGIIRIAWDDVELLS